MRRIANGAQILSCWLALLLLAGALACNRSDAPPAESGQTPQAPAQAQAPAPAPAPPSYTPAQLDELLAPIALYPDTLLAQVLAASTNAQEVLDAGNWLLQNQALKGEALNNAAIEAGFGPSVQSLVHFPTVVDMMCQQLSWTTQLGEAFAADQSAVLVSVQRLRAQAVAMGNLASTPEQKVEQTEVKDEAGAVKQVVTVEPAQPQVVYVPQYNPQQVYSTPAPAATTTASSNSGISTGEAVVGGLMAFGLGVMIGNAFDDDDDCCYPNWGGGGVYYGGSRYSHNNIIYAPHYGGNFRPANGYRRPANYPYAYDRASRARNATGNANLNQSNYFDRYQGGTPRAQARPATATPGAAREARAGNQPVGEYKGARREGSAAQQQAAAAREAGAKARPSGAYAGQNAASKRNWDGAGTRSDLGRGASAGRAGLPSATSAKKTPAASARPAMKQQAGARPSAAARAPQPSRQQVGALSGSRSGSYDRVASSRGRSSSAGRQPARTGGGGGGGRGGGGGGGRRGR